MAIRVVSSPRLACSPSPTQIPIRLDVRQTLESNRTSESVTFVYTLAETHDVWFDTAAGLSKKSVRDGKVGGTEQPIHHRLKLRQGPGRGPLDAVQITQTIIGAGGRETHNVCSVIISSYQ